MNILSPTFFILAPKFRYFTILNWRNVNGWLANSEDPDETQKNEESQQGLVTAILGVRNIYIYWIVL